MNKDEFSKNVAASFIVAFILIAILFMHMMVSLATFESRLDIMGEEIKEINKQILLQEK